MAKKTFIGQTFDIVKRNKEGAIAGALLGVAGTFILGATGADLNFALQSVGIVDNLVSVGTTSIQLAQTKVGLALILLGSGIGILEQESRRSR